ncbi:flagellar filament capping protein FliD [Viridibacillus sp. FSL R5-0468]|uniref:flagellar filament capping protein FliD n=1 Tax=Viridibacillus sp. FSL R5-0468 TaxID=2921640 RepID=UPI0030FA261C
MVNRVGGLASGMDIDALVEKLMTAERVPLNKLNQKKTTYEWQRDAYRSVNTKLKTFSDYLFDNFSLTSNFVKNKVNVSNSKAISVSAGSGASGTLNIQGIGKLATSASKVTGSTALSKNALSSDDKLSDFGVPTSGKIVINVNGEDKELDLSPNTTLADLQSKLGSGVVNVSGGKISFGDANVVVNDPTTKSNLEKLGITFSNTLDVGGSKKPSVDIDNTTDLASLGINGTLTFKVGDTTKTLTVGTDVTNVQDLIDKLGTDFKLSVKDGQLSFGVSGISVVGDDTKNALETLGFEIGNKATSTEGVYATSGSNGNLTNTSLIGELGLKGGKLELEVMGSNGKMSTSTISYSESDTVESFMKKLNGAGLTALVTTDGNMSITANATGEGIGGAAIRVKSDKTDGATPTDKGSDGVLQKLGLASKTTDSNGNYTVADGTDAAYKVNGLDMTSKSNSVTISGYTVTLNETYNSTVDGSGKIEYGTAAAISVSADKDIDSMVDKVKEFVSKYNELIAGLNDHLKETKYRDYTPLTAEQRKDMTESEQKLWDEKAMSGLLRGDSILRNGLGDMRNALYSQVKGLGLGNNVIDTMFKMGITTSSNFNDGGKLVIDETKLRKALEEDPDRVVKTLTQNGSKTDSEGDTRGIVQRLRDSMSDFTKNIEKKAGRATMTDNQFAIGKNLIDTNKRITTLTDRLKDVEARYWKQFTAMETAINKANSQSSIFAQFGGQ